MEESILEFQRDKETKKKQNHRNHDNDLIAELASAQCPDVPIELKIFIEYYTCEAVPLVTQTSIYMLMKVNRRSTSAAF